MNPSTQARFISKGTYWSAIVLSGVAGWKLGNSFTIRISYVAHAVFSYWSLALLLGQLVTAMVCFVLLYRCVGFGLAVRLLAKRGITLQAESVFEGLFLSAFLPLLMWAISDALMFDAFRSGMHDSM